MPNWCLTLHIKRLFHRESDFLCFLSCSRRIGHYRLGKALLAAESPIKDRPLWFGNLCPSGLAPYSCIAKWRQDRIHYSNFKRFPNGLRHTNTHTYIHLLALCFENICSTHESHGLSYFSRSRSLLLKCIGSCVIKDLQRIQLLLLANLNTDIFSHFPGLFHAFDENRDNHIDFKEISCGLSACCRGPVAERQKCKHLISYYPLLVVHLILRLMQDCFIVFKNPLRLF